MAIMVTNPDPSWRPALRKRDAILWLCPHAVELHGGDQRDMLQTYLRRTWRTVFSDLPDSLDREVETMECRDEELTLRFFVENAGPDNLPPNRLPVYWLRGEEGNTAPGVIDDPAAMLERLTMLKHAPDNKEVFVFGVTSEDDLEGVIEAARLSEAFQQLVIVTSASLDLSCLDDVAIRVFHWKTDSDSISKICNRVSKPRYFYGKADVTYSWAIWLAGSGFFLLCRPQSSHHVRIRVDFIRGNSAGEKSQC